MTLKITIATLLFTCASLWAKPKKPHKADLIIYGGTSTAVMAGVQASQMGKSVIIVSPDKHLGGLSSGGLGWTDNGHAAGIGGLSRQFYQRIKAHYDQAEAWRQQTRTEFRAIPRSQSRNRPGDDAMWIFEPHVAEKLFDQYVAENNITVIRDAWLDRDKGVTKDGTRIVAITTLDGKIFQGEVFIDATYEGDLMAAAGVRYHVGREANSVYNETINGVQSGRRDHPHHFDITGLEISPYKIPGDPKSGLLPRISAKPLAADGTGDHRIQAYCFRACLTNDPDNRIPFPKPDNYDPEQYEVLLRVLQADWPEFFRKFDPAPNKKTDQNNHGPFSTDNIGYNYDYPEASYERRREIIKQHEDYQKGLMYFVANDPRVPKDVQNELRQWGLPKDEFVDNGHWSHQLYIREARRMIGQHVVTEHDVNNKTEVNDSIGMGVYTMDSHNVQRYITADGFVENEGNVGAHIRSAYPIPFGAILPRPEECTNLLVPGAISSSHIAFGSLRMEPTFMILGQSAGTAAAIAIEKDIPVQDVDYQNDLQPRLLADKQRLEPNRKGKEKAKEKTVSRNTFMVFGNTYITTLETKTSILASINQAVKDADIDFVIMVGELTMGATIDQFEAVKYVMDNSPVPVHVTASNHDLAYTNGDWKSGTSDDYARFRKMLGTETEYTIAKGRSYFIMQSHTGSVGTDFTNNELAKLEENTSYDFVYQVVEASLGAEIDRKRKPIIGINGGNNEVKYHVIGDRHVKVVPIENKKTDDEDDYLIFKENEGHVVVDSYVGRSLEKSFEIVIDRSAGTCSVER